MKHFFITPITFFLSWTLCLPLLADTSPGFELALSTQDYLYEPHQYKRSMNTSFRMYSTNGPLQRNRGKTTPFQLAYNGEAFRVEFSYYKLSLPNMYHFNATLFSSGIWVQQIPINQDSRSESELNFLYKISPKGDFRFALGAGIRRIRTKYESSSLLNFYTRDNFDSLGPQIGFRLSYNFLENLGLFLDYNLLYTRGRRDYKYSYLYQGSSGPVLVEESQAYGTIGEYYGNDVKGGLSVRLSSTAALRIGYNVKDLRFRYKNYYINSVQYSLMYSKNLTAQLAGIEDWKNDRLEGGFLELRVSF